MGPQEDIDSSGGPATRNDGKEPRRATPFEASCLRFTEPTTIRLRFFNFNMANMAALDPFVGMLGQFLAKPFADAAKVDATFVALTEVGWGWPA